MSTIAVFAAAAAVTFLLRSVMMVAGDRLAESPLSSLAIGLAAPAVLAGLVVSALMVEAGEPTTPDVIEVLAAGGALLAVHRTGNVGAALAVGLLIAWAAALPGLV